MIVLGLGATLITILTLTAFSLLHNIEIATKNAPGRIF
jgi:hypothetical protein